MSPNSYAAGYFAEEVRRELSEKYGEKKLYEGGLSVRTTLDPKMQLMARKALVDGLVRFDEAQGFRGAMRNISVTQDWGVALAEVPAIAEIAEGMIHSALDSYAAQDAALAEDVVARDEQVDALYRDLIRDLIELLSTKTANVITATELLLIARNLERIGDNATNIAEAVYYAATGAVMPDRHKSAE